MPMSEFSRSLHMRSTSADEAVDLLRRAGVAGVVAPSDGGWVPFYPPLMPDVRSGVRVDLDRIVALASPRVLILWDYAENHGMSVEVYRDGVLRALLETMWETRETRYWDRQTFLDLGLLTEADAIEIDAWLARHEPGYVVAERLGLRGYANVEAERAWSAFDAGKLPQGTRLVRRDGTITSHDSPD